jgi:TRAP-type C4-dicarboxylate transport system substrate-binding protein
MRRAYVAVVALGLLGAAAPLAQAQTTTTLSIATLAPDGSAWMKVFNDFNAEVQQKTGGSVKFQFFAGGVAGDEKDTVRKMRGGSLDGAAITAVGLGQIAPQVRVLELPFLVQTDGELDYVRNQLSGQFTAAFSAAGFKLLSWGDVGWVYLWSNTSITSRGDLDNTKMWAWTDDPVVQDMFGKLNVSTVPLGVPDVYTSLQTGLINACYGPPLAVLSLQWYTKVKDVTSIPISKSVGAIVLTNDAWNKLTTDQQNAVTAASADLQTEFTNTIRTQNNGAMAVLLKHGITQVTTPPTFVTDMTSQAQGVWTDLEGKLYPASLLTQVQSLLATYRASPH